MLLRPGNTKLGRLVWTWSLPAGQTCPGKTTLCFNACYARKGHYLISQVIGAAYQKNLQLANSDEFVPQMIEEIRNSGVRIIRLHSSGDFHSRQYVERWIEIAKACPRVVLYGYTRSWRAADLLPALRRFAALPNVRLWWSEDRETGRSPRCQHTRIAWMATHDGDLPPRPAGLVFRVQRATAMRKDAAGNHVCRYDTGIGPKPTCSRCGLCFAKIRTRGHNVGASH